MAKIAVDVDRALKDRAAQGTPGRATPRIIAWGEGWSVADVICTSGPQDRPFEERHAQYSVVVVVAGSFEYRSPLGSGLMTPGSIMLGNAGQCYECGHDHAAGDRCVSFSYEPEYFEQLAADAGARADVNFAAPRIPPIDRIAPLVAHAGVGAVGSADVAWEELSMRLAARAFALGGKTSQPPAVTSSAVARVTQIVRTIERRPDARFSLGRLAELADLSPYHFLRTFERVTGITPHQYILRTRLREAALRVAAEPRKIVDIALDCGFSDVSNFNHAFRREFGVNPGGYRTMRFSEF